ncbi:MAG: di-trans,poly-cis-decaprenylcistransferase, partial [Clostridia bacterium]|nr:di-trans,poly-cis-decaprenylcistransferase [Clostridia bacterium]
MSKILQHIAFIMDGNGRWASMRGLSRNFGHKQGLETVKDVVGWCRQAGIKVVSLYVFSTENWKRPQKEVDGIFSLAQKYLDKLDVFCRDGIRIVVSGSKAKLPEKLVDKIDNIVRKTATNEQITVNLCLNYGGRDEIVCAVNNILAKGGTVTEQSLLSAMYVDLPEPDLIVRTGGHMRLSNFLLYQSAYAELYFSDTLWPDFSKEEFDKILSNSSL